MDTICWSLLLGVIMVYLTYSNAGIPHERKINYVAGKPKSVRDISQHDLDTAIQIAEDQIQKMATFEHNIHLAEVRTENGSPFYGQLMDFSATEEALNSSQNAFVAIKASQYLASKHCPHSPAKMKQCVDQLSTLKLPEANLGSACSSLFDVHCNSATKYSSVDGSCNNLQHPTWGKSNTAYRRLLKPEYNDGISTLRSRSVSGSALANARLVSTTVARNDHVMDETNATQAAPIWGLFVSYDLSHAPASNMVNTKTPVTCCTNDGRPLSPRHSHISCAPIAISQGDLFYGRFFQTCMNYVRTVPAMRATCTFGPAEQMNQASHFLDGSVIYGSSERKSRTLRSMWGGRLLTTMEKSGKQYPPVAKAGGMECHTNSKECYDAGDNRINSQPQLRVLHTMFLREHNRIADHLFVLNEHWTDERIFQETRKIVIAQIQHITYNHWLPHLIGREFTKTNALADEDSAQAGLKEDVGELDPTISNSFGVTAPAVFYSMIDGNIGLYKENRDVNDATQMKEHFVKNSGRNKEIADFFDSIVRGLASQHSLKVDTSFTDAVTQYWYSQSGEFGMDLLSLDIQRGRDHGLPGYINYRKYCNLPEISTFDELEDIVSENTIDRLETVYATVADIDLLIGAVAELPAEGAMVGPTLQCILAEQFYRTRHGDKAFHDNPNNGNKFTPEQLVQIKRSSLARIFCDNSNKVKQMQSDVFALPNGNSNGLVNCQETALPFINLSAWKENK